VDFMNEIKLECLSFLLIGGALGLLITSITVHVNSLPNDFSSFYYMCGALIFMASAAGILYRLVKNQDESEDE